MMAEGRNVVRLVAVQHLRAAYGIKTKNWNKNKAGSCKPTTTNSKVFGVPLENLPYYDMAHGKVPRFLVDACMKLQAHVDTEGLFRKSGSVVRLKALRAKVDLGEEWLSAALPCDVAGLVKQFFRELPEPVLPTELHEAFLKAQQLPANEERISATMLLSCVLPDMSLSVLHHFFDFLQNVSKRSAENKMDSANLSVILAPNLLHFGEGTEKMNSNTEKRIRLQTAVVHCFIEHAHNFGVLPDFLEEKVADMTHGAPEILSPVFNELQELDQNSGMKWRHRQSLGVFSSATPVIVTPSSKRKLPIDSGYSFGFSNKKRRSVKKNFGMELLPSSLVSGMSTPGSAYSASGVFDSSQSTLSSAGKCQRQPATSTRKKNRRLSGRNAVSRVESGRAGCFSPKVDKKEAQRKSLRQRFSLGRSHKDAGSESIGWRLATQESVTSFCFTKEQSKNAQSSSSKFISKSEDNLLTPQREPWSGEASGEAPPPFSEGSFPDTPTSVCLKSRFVSEPAIVVSEPLAAFSLSKNLCCASSGESLESGSPLKVGNSPAGSRTHELKTEPSDDISPPSPKTPAVARPTEDAPMSKFPTPRELNVTFDIGAVSPLHIDSIILNPAQGSFCQNCSDTRGSDDTDQQVGCSRLLEALDMQSPAHFGLGASPGLRSTPFERAVAARRADASSPEAGARIRSHPRVADHIQHFNRLTLKSPRGAKSKDSRSPLKFERTPVRQAVRRINSLLGERGGAPPRARAVKVVKALSLESGLSPHPPSKGKDVQVVLDTAKPLKKAPPVPPKKPSALAAKSKTRALGDMTNRAQTKPHVDSAIWEPAGAQKAVVQKLAENEAPYYRGSPRNPLNQRRLLPATKPFDL